MRIRTDGDYAWRADDLEQNAELWDCNKTDAVLKAIGFSRAMLGTRGRLQRALEHPDMTPELAELLETPETEHVFERHAEVRLK